MVGLGRSFCFFLLKRMTKSLGLGCNLVLEFESCFVLGGFVEGGTNWVWVVI